MFASFDFQETDELESHKDSPEEVAANFTCAMFDTPQVVLRGARHMVLNISCNLYTDIYRIEASFELDYIYFI